MGEYKCFGAGDRPKEADGYLTLYLALTLAAILSLFLALLRGARIGAARMQLDSVSHISQNAVLAEFEKDLQKRYDLFFVDTSYGGGNASLENVRSHLQGYVEGNLTRKTSIGNLNDLISMKVDDVQIQEARYACDNGAQAVREQVYAYMSADPAGAIVAPVLVGADVWRGMEIEGREWKTETEESRKELADTLKEERKAVRKNVKEKEKAGEEVSDEERDAASGEKTEAEEMVEEVHSFQSLPILRQVFGDTASLSAQMIDTGQQLSHRGVHLGSGMSAENSHSYPRADELLFDEYIMEKTGNYTEPLPDGRLKYQVEYILCGKGSDRENLEGVAARLLLIRETSNCIYLFANSGKMARVRAVAGVISLVLLSPELEEPIEKALALAWSYIESVQDVRTLLGGGKVPLRKTDASWQTGLGELLAPARAIRDRDSGQGLDYGEYLRGLLYLEGSTVKTKRTMDIMEMDLRTVGENENFRLDQCMDTFRMSVTVNCGWGYTCGFSGTAGYD